MHAEFKRCYRIFLLLRKKNILKLQIIYGNLIYQSKVGKYEEAPWDGFYNSKKLPVGSYYYIIEYNDGFTTNKTGIVTIIE